MKVCKEYSCDEEAAPARSRCWHHYYIHRSGGAPAPQAPDGKMKVLYIDIETRPNLVYTWGLFNQNIGVNQIVEPCRMLCFAAKWEGQDEIEFYSEWDQGQMKMVLEAWRLLDSADCVVHYYGSQFDRPHLYREFLLQGFPPPSPFRQIDLKLAVGKQFKFTSNKLQFVSEILGLGGKEEHEGFPLWSKVINGDADAQERMRTYNMRDVELLDELYQVLLPWIPGHPSRTLYEPGACCPRCAAGVELMVDSGYYFTKLSKFEQFRCKSCDGYFRSSKRVMGVTLQESTL